MTRFLVFLATLLVALAGGLWLGGHPQHLPGPVRDAFVSEDRALEAEVIKAIEGDYYKKVPRDKLDQASLRGMVESLKDRFSHYLTPKERDAFEDAIDNRFEGVGMAVERHRKGLEVQRVFEKTPAQRGGIRVGDLITEVNGRSLAGKPADASTSQIKGKPGTLVRLTVVTPGKKPRELKLRRAKITVPPVRARMRQVDGKKLAVVELVGFGQGVHGLLRKQIDRVLARGAEGIVLDLRGNGGGLLSEGVLVSSIFIEDGPVVSTRGRTRSERKYDAEGDAIDAKVPVVVLVDRGSASASEIVTGALRDRKRATVVGTRTFGKGVFQEYSQLSNGGALSLTVGSYYLPGGDNISDKGIEPQVKARDLPRTRRDEALPRALEVLAGKTR